MENHLITLLKEEYETRKFRNSAYSLRAFAKHLGIGIASLSDVLKGKRSLSPKNKIKIAEKLQLSPEQKRELFLKTIDNPTPIIEEENFKFISDWYHYGILVLSEIKDHKTAPSWVSQKLGISTQEAKDGITRLIKLGLLKKEDGKFIKGSAPFTTTMDIPSAAIKKRHLQILDKGKDSIINLDVDERFFFETTMAIDPKNFEKAKEMIMKYMRKVVKQLESGNQKEVFTLTTGLFPLKIKKD
jgi:uncharacterized protein (TIGR02147 family)